MKVPAIALTAILSFAIPAAMAGELAFKKGDVAYQRDLAAGIQPQEASPANCAKTIPGENGGGHLEISAVGSGGAGALGNMNVLGVVEKSKASTYLISIKLDDALAKFKGYELEIEVGVKSENVTPPANPWDGVKISMEYEVDDCRYNQGVNGLFGSFDWKTATFSTRIPEDAKGMTLLLGLVAPSGKVSFNQVKATVKDLPFKLTPASQSPVFKGHDLPRLRGFNTGIRLPGSQSGKESISDIAQNWKANVIKCSFTIKERGDDLKKTDASLAAWLDSVEQSLPLVRSEKMYIILQVCTGWQVKEHGGNDLIYENPIYEKKLLEVWTAIAKRFKGRREIYAFELLNESCLRLPPASECHDYLSIIDRLAQAVNENDPDRAIIVQTEEWWGPKAFYKMRPIKARNIVYALHFYSPFLVSHQGISNWYAGETSWTAYAYPGTIDGRKWNKETLRAALKPVLSFQQATNAHIIVSEFSCIRWALGDSRRKLLGDMIDLFEENGWDWTYHAYPEFHGWMPNLGNDPWSSAVPPTPTATESLLKDWFKKNQRPAL